MDWQLDRSIPCGVVLKFPRWPRCIWTSSIKSSCPCSISICTRPWLIQCLWKWRLPVVLDQVHQLLVRQRTSCSMQLPILPVQAEIMSSRLLRGKSVKLRVTKELAQVFIQLWYQVTLYGFTKPVAWAVRGSEALWDCTKTIQQLKESK